MRVPGRPRARDWAAAAHHGRGGETQDYPALLLARPCGFLVGTARVEGRGCGCRAGPGRAWTGCIGIISSISGGDCPPGGTPPPPPAPPGQGHIIAPSGRGQGLSRLGPPWDRVILQPEDDWLVWLVWLVALSPLTQLSFRACVCLSGKGLH